MSNFIESIDDIGFKAFGELSEGDPVFVMKENLENGDKNGDKHIHIDYIYRCVVCENSVADKKNEGTLWLEIQSPDDCIKPANGCVDVLRVIYHINTSKMTSFFASGEKLFYLVSSDAFSFQYKLDELMKFSRKTFDMESYTKMGIASNRIKEMILYYDTKKP